ncbi:hypothetical protein H310_05973 [Aphanomyces invadans]|uniref:VTT domain-containing protein n=1 Tax=Aphanomyces invadans TaxID=157072 RepID=A0A024U884_9STRA|nr:hypothetical protein H310_05973 [Aphanomyces invadans]ETW02464.1 hypothetical protein H310_05973 [Aphanomyces invadans]|eukprot:XP_008869069.1 hypothetical protein H310_05973 [Aphanomyces invadans]
MQKSMGDDANAVRLTYQSIPMGERAAPKESSPRTSHVLAGILAVVFCVVVILSLWAFAQTQAFRELVRWEQDHQVLGGLIYVLFYAACVVLCCPSTIFDLLAGYIFGFGFGTAVAMGGKTLGSVVAFLLGRYVMHDTIRRKLTEGPPVLRAWALLLERNELQFVLLLQFAYIPIFLKNYGLAVAGVPFGLFLWTNVVIGGARTWLAVYIGHSTAHITEILTSHAARGDARVAQEVLMIVAVVSTLLLFVVGSYRTKQYLDELADREVNALVDNGDKGHFEL